MPWEQRIWYNVMLLFFSTIKAKVILYFRILFLMSKTGELPQSASHSPVEKFYCTIRMRRFSLVFDTKSSKKQEEAS